MRHNRQKHIYYRILHWMHHHSFMVLMIFFATLIFVGVYPVSSNYSEVNGAIPVQNEFFRVLLGIIVLIEIPAIMFLMFTRSKRSVALARKYLQNNHILPNFNVKNTLILSNIKISKNRINFSLDDWQIRKLFTGNVDTFLDIAWSPDGKLLASASDDKTIRLWDAKHGALWRTFTGHSETVTNLAWSPDGCFLASASKDYTIRLWNIETENCIVIDHSKRFNSIAWSPDGELLASASEDKAILLWNVKTSSTPLTLAAHSKEVNCVAWSPDGELLASASNDKTVRLWNIKTSKFLTLAAHSKEVNCVAWSPDGSFLASVSNDKTIRLWDVKTERQLSTFEGHTKAITWVSFYPDGSLLASQSIDGTIRFWNIERGEIQATLTGNFDRLSGTSKSNFAFHPIEAMIAVIDAKGLAIRIYDFDLEAILKAPPITSSVQYTNAKVVLVGDSGMGKSGLGLVLAGEEFAPTDSTHGRRIWPFESKTVENEQGHKETHEILLWDLAGQPGYRLIHQLHLNEVSVALIVFDSRSETDPFAGVQHWDRALQLAQKVQGASALPLKKFLVAARADRGGRSVSQERIDTLMKERGFAGYFETSAKEGCNIADLREAIREAIEWNEHPKVNSTKLFQSIKDFLIAEKESGHILSKVDDLYRTFLKSEFAPTDSKAELAQFETCIGRVESRGLIKRLSFGNLVLLQPEILDAYASALVNAVKDEPEGFGNIAEERVRQGDFAMPADARISDKDQEKLLLLAMIEDLISYEIALREQNDLVFPSQSTRENPDLPNPEGKAATFSFEGPVLNIYATLVVRLAHSDLFKMLDLWKNAVTYTTSTGGTYGIFLRNIDEGRGELTLFFDEAASKEMRTHFEEFIQTHLMRRALPESIRHKRLFVCPQCSTPFTDLQVARRKELGHDWIFCNVCETRVPLQERDEPLPTRTSSVVQEMDQAADNRRDRETAKSILQGKIKTQDFDVFLCHNGEDKSAVKLIGEQLKERGILPWLDEWELRPGYPWQRLLEQQIKQIKAAAVFIGKRGRGPWQDHELYAFLRQFTKRDCPVIPVILPDCDHIPDVPPFLEGMTWVDFRKDDPDPLNRLIWGITGERDFY